MNSALNPASVWLIAFVTIGAILLRPKKWPEAVWACGGAGLLVWTGLIPVAGAVGAVRRGTDVYLFLAGMMLLAELARREGVFEWLASLAVGAAKGSRVRLFTLVYAVGIVVTALLSNDATAVVLTPAVYAAVRKARVAPMPYLFACAFIANAASFVLPVSNPANLVIYGAGLPSLGAWLRAFLLPSVVAIAVTYATLFWISRRELRGAVEAGKDIYRLSASGRRAVVGLVSGALVMVTASALGWNLGAVTCVVAVPAILLATGGDGLGSLLSGVSWSVLSLVAGLFVIVEALYGAGAMKAAGVALHWLRGMPVIMGSLAASFGIAALSNLMNNLPSGLLTAGAVQTFGAPEHLRRALLIGVDLGPNLSVTGSLATILWLVALRRDGVNISVWTFLKAGLVVMVPALVLAVLASHWPA